MNDLAPVLRVLEAYQAAVYHQDVDAFLALYDPNVHVFDMWGRWSYNGIEAWREMVTGWFGSLGTERVVVALEDVQGIVSNDLAIAHAFLTFKAVSAEGKELRAMNNRLTLALEQKGGAWKIVHEHTSAPVNFETGKVMLQR